MVDIINLPPLPGLPDVNLADPATLPAAAALVTADDPAALAALGSPGWGIWSEGSPVILADTVVDLSYDKGYQISDFPVESGAFASYDKVELAYESRVRFASGGSATVRSQLVESVEAIIGDLKLYDVVTPDKIYVSANLTREGYRRTQGEGGGSLLSVEVGVQQVRVLSGASGNSTKDPASADQQNGGTVQPNDTVSLPYEVTDGIEPSSVEAGTASQTAASSSLANGDGYTSVPLPPERPATLYTGSAGIGRA